MALSFPIEDLLPIAWSRGQIVQVAHFRHNDNRTVALVRLQSLLHPGSFGLVAHDIAPGREEQLVAVESTISMRNADVRVTFTHNFVAQTPAGDVLVVLSSKEKDAVEVKVEAGGGRNRPIWPDAYNLMIRKPTMIGTNGDASQIPHPEFGDEVKLGYSPVEVSIEDPSAQRTSDPEKLPIALLRRRDRAFEVDAAWAPPAASVEIALGVSATAWELLRGTLNTAVVHMGSLRPEGAGGQAMRERVRAHQDLVRQMRDLLLRMGRPEALTIEDVAESLWKAIRGWEAETVVLQAGLPKLDEALFLESLAKRKTSEILGDLDAAIKLKHLHDMPAL